MNKVKLFISGLTAFCLACTCCTSLCSCGNKKNTALTSENSAPSESVKNTNKTDKASPQKITRFFDEKETSFNNYSMQSNILAGDSNSFYMISKADKIPSSFSTIKINLSDGSQSSAADEHGPQTQYCDVSLRTSDGICWASRGTTEREMILHCTDIATGNDKTVSFDSATGVSSIHTDAQQNLYVITYDAMFIFTKELEQTKKVEISKLISETGCPVNMVYASCVSSDGNIFLGCWNKGNDTYCIFKLDKDEKLTDLTGVISDMEGSLTNMFACDDGSVIMCTGYAGLMINKFDMNTGDTILRYELQDAQEVYGACCGYDMVYHSSDGIFGYNYQDDESTSLISQDVYTGEDKEFYNIQLTGDTAYVTSALYEDTGEHLIKLDPDGNVLNDYKLPQVSENSGLSCMYTGADGNVYYLITNRGTGSDGDGNYYETSSFTVYKIDSSGESIKMFETPTLDYDYTPMALSLDKNGNILIPVCDINYKLNINVYAPDGTLTDSISTPDNLHYLTFMFTGEDGSVYTVDSGKVYKIDTDTMSVTQLPDCSTALYSNNFYAGSNGYDFYYSTNCGIFGYSIKDNKTDEIILWTDTDYEGDPQQCCVLSPEEIIVAAYEADDVSDMFSFKIKKLVKASQERLDELNSRKVVTLAGTWLSQSGIGSKIKKFNKTSDKYRICARDYSLYDKNTEDSYIPGSSQLDNDLINGNIPDILMLDNDMDVMSYLSKGFLADMNSFIDNDPDIKREDYYTNIFDAYTFDDKLFYLPVSYELNTYASRTSMSGSFDNWTYDDFLSFVSTNEDIPVFNHVPRETVLNQFMTSYINDFVDFKQHSCDFNNETFLRLLDVIKNNTDQDDDMKYGYDEHDPAALKDNSVLLSPYSSMDILSYHQLVQCYAAEPVSINGVASKSSGKNIVSSSEGFSISESSKEKEGAWEFIKQFLTDDIQYTQEGYSRVGIYGSYPVKRSSLQKKIDETASDPEATSYAYTENGEVKIPPLNDEEINAYKQYLDKPAVSGLIYSKILDIIQDETNAFFSSDCTASDAASAVQSKVTLYLNELL
ncbi:MAG: hypothetical protein Q4F95_04180 [Oscillospiraceae bacterium]|nr:hypothetical protein [Oscillospiraceae bacterium]